MDLAQLSAHAEVWEKAVRKLRGGMMPPPGCRRPDPAAVDAFVAWLERSLDEAAAARSQSGPRRAASPEPHRVRQRDRGPARRCASTRRRFLPQDDEADGFDNVASVLTVSPSFLDQYISAARDRQHPRDRQSARHGRRAPTTGRRAAPIRRCTSTVCRSARAAVCWSSICFPPTATTS